jgi:hypothetical protein
MGSEMIAGLCPHCQQAFTVPPEFIGKRAKCNQCGQAFTIAPPDHAHTKPSTKAGQPAQPVASNPVQPTLSPAPPEPMATPTLPAGSPVAAEESPHMPVLPTGSIDPTRKRQGWKFLGLWVCLSIVFPLFVGYMVNGQVSLWMPSDTQLPGRTFTAVDGGEWKFDPSLPANSSPSKWPFVLLCTLPFLLSPLLIRSLRCLSPGIGAWCSQRLGHPIVGRIRGRVVSYEPLKPDRLKSIVTRIDGDVRSAKNFVQAKVEATRLSQERKSAEGELNTAYREIGIKAEKIGLGPDLPAFNGVVAGRKKLTDAEAVLAQKRIAITQAQEALQAATDKPQGMAALQSANAAGAQAARDDEGARASLNTSLQAFGKTVFDAGLGEDQLASEFQRVKATLERISEIDRRSSGLQMEAAATGGKAKQVAVWVASAVLLCLCLFLWGGAGIIFFAVVLFALYSVHVARTDPRGISALWDRLKGIWAKVRPGSFTAADAAGSRILKGVEDGKDIHYYYANEQNLPVGPYTAEQMQQLRQAGTLQENTWVILEGATEWKSYASLLQPASDEGQNKDRRKRCSSCGAENGDQARFCAGCGAKLEPLPGSEVSRVQSAGTAFPQSGGLPVQPLASTPDSPLRGYGGWLALYCALWVFLVPVLMVVFIYLKVSSADMEFAKNYPRTNFWLNVEFLIQFAFYGFGMFVGIQLRRLRPGAVRMVKRFWIAALVFSFLCLFSTYLFDNYLPTKAIEVFSKDAKEGFGRTLVGFAIWFNYFRVSKRVKANFPNG